MTRPINNDEMNDDDWNELHALKNAINSNPASVHPEKMELFTELMIKSLRYRGG